MTELLKAILIVDDNQTLLDALKVYVESEGYTVHLAQDGQDALNFLMENSVYAVLSDIKMPNMSGIDLIRSVRERGISVPFLFFTGYADNHLIIEALQNGACDFLLKPFHFGQIRDSLNRILEIGAKIISIQSRLENLEISFQSAQSEIAKITRDQAQIARLTALTKKS